MYLDFIMSSLEKTSSVLIVQEAANNDVFSVWANTAVNNIISLAEARERYGKMNKGAHWAEAFVRYVLGSMWIDIWSNVAMDASTLVQLRVAAANDSTTKDQKAA